jgi:hypothetical protein
MLDDLFYDASSVYTIQEETAFGSNIWQYLDVRINQALDRQTGNKLGNDFKMLLFKDLDHSTGLGREYYFDSNTWVTVNLEDYKGVAKTSIIRRCNATLRWVDENGNSYSEPCAIDYQINTARDDTGRNTPIVPQGDINVYCQLNNDTKLIKGNQRFIFGPVENRIAFKVFGNGVRNFLNERTVDDSSCSLLILTMGADSINSEEDDLENGIANYYKNLYTLSLSPSMISTDIGDSIQIIPELIWDSSPSDKSISYNTSNNLIATVSASGLITTIASGSAIITGCMVDNISIIDTIVVSVSSSSVSTYEVRVNPTDNFIYEGDTETYSIYLYVNGVVQSNSFIFTLADANVPPDYYVLTVLNGNSFSIRNDKFYLSDPLSISCTSGSYSKQLDIYLRGSW